MNNVLGDIRYALRRAASRPGFTAIAIISLALGIGADTAAFSLINAIFRQFSISGFTGAPRDFGDHVETITGQTVNGNYFPLIGMRPVLGRLLGPEDDRVPGGHPVIDLSYSYWQKSFNGDSGVVARTLRLSGRG